MICASQLANLYGFSRVRAVVHAHTCTASHPLAVLRPRPSLAPVKFCLSKKMTLPINYPSWGFITMEMPWKSVDKRARQAGFHPAVRAEGTGAGVGKRRQLQSN